MIVGKNARTLAIFVMTLASLLCLVPFVLILMSSITDENVLLRHGYAFWPSQFGFQSYEYLWQNNSMILRAYGITLIVTAIGTSLSIFCTLFLAYPLSISGLPGRNFVSFFVYFTMLFSGGIVPSYILWARLLGVKNTLWALIFPALLVKAFYVIMMRTYFKQNVPPALLESARMDGAKEFRILFRIVLPISKPMLASLGLLIGLSYWNDWMNGLYYITDSSLYSIQNLLNRMLREIQFLASGAGGELGEGMAQLPSVGIRMAIVIIGIIPIVILYPFIQKYLVKGMVMGAIKE